MIAWAMQTLDVAAVWLVAAALRVTVDGLLVALPVWLACRFAPSIPASARTWLWWGVSLKLLLSLAGAPSVSLPVLPAGMAPLTPALSPHTARGGSTFAPSAIVDAGPTATARARQSAAAPGFNASPAGSAGGAEPLPALTLLLRALTGIWAIAVLAQFALIVLDAWRLRRLVARARPPAAALADEHEDLARDLGLKTIPALRESADIAAPQVVGVLRPTVLLPIDSAISPHERSMVLCHELAHVRRADLLLGWIPALAARLLVWHPLARLAAREYALAREAACDALVLHTLDTPPRDYGRLLVRLGVHAPAARIAAAGTSPTARLLHRRLHMLQHASLSPRALTGVAMSAAVLALLPLRLVAFAPSDWVDAPQAMAASPGVGVASASRTANTASHAPSPQAEPRTARGRDDAWVYFYAGDNTVSMHGDGDDMRLARRLQGGRSGPFFVVRRNGEVFTVEDASTLARIESIFEPQRKLGEQQGELGRRQGELGAQQGELGERQGRLGEQQGELGHKQAEMSARAMEISAQRQLAAAKRIRGEAANNDTAEKLEREAREKSRELDRLVTELSERQQAIGRQQEELGREQAKLGEKQAALGGEQAKLGKLQEEAGRQAERQMRELVDAAIAAGVAKRVK
jgi:beta-lactamase regulating signal transducer with metallopeptidase domain